MVEDFRKPREMKTQIQPMNSPATNTNENKDDNIFTKYVITGDTCEQVLSILPITVVTLKSIVVDYLETIWIKFVVEPDSNVSILSWRSEYSFGQIPGSTLSRANLTFTPRVGRYFCPHWMPVPVLPILNQAHYESAVKCFAIGLSLFLETMQQSLLKQPRLQLQDCVGLENWRIDPLHDHALKMFTELKKTETPKTFYHQFDFVSGKQCYFQFTDESMISDVILKELKMIESIGFQHGITLPIV